MAKEHAVRGGGGDPGWLGRMNGKPGCGDAGNPCPAHTAIGGGPKARGQPGDKSFRGSHCRGESQYRLALGQRASGLAGRVLSRVSRRDNASGRAVLGWLPSVGRQWTQARDMPVPPRQSFRQWWQGRSR